MPVHHYENFPVASFALPSTLRHPVEVFYAFARTADDIADEGDAPAAKPLNSIFTQSYKHIEAIVINDGGEDVSDVIAPFEGMGDITHIRLSRRKGPAAARNAGLRRAKRKYITYLDDDDIYYPQHVETLVRFMECGDHKVAYSDSYQAFQEWDGRRFMTVRKKRQGQDFDKQRLLIKDYIPILSIMHRKECIEETGLFDEGLKCTRTGTF